MVRKHSTRAFTALLPENALEAILWRFRAIYETLGEATMTYDEILDAAWDELHHEWGVSTDVLQVVTDINGYNLETLRDILYATNGERTFNFEDEEE